MSGHGRVPFVGARWRAVARPAHSSEGGERNGVSVTHLPRANRCCRALPSWGSERCRALPGVLPGVAELGVQGASRANSRPKPPTRRWSRRTQSPNRGSEPPEGPFHDPNPQLDSCAVPPSRRIGDPGRQQSDSTTQAPNSTVARCHPVAESGIQGASRANPRPKPPTRQLRGATRSPNRGSRAPSERFHDPSPQLDTDAAAPNRPIGDPGLRKGDLTTQTPNSTVARRQKDDSAAQTPNSA
jgi:hypothetical protein